MENTTKKTGDIGEIIAIKYLQKHSYKILDTNFKFGRFGEVDVITRKGDLVIFFEIKYRNNIFYGIPEESITQYKLSKCSKTIDFYCKKNYINFEQIRFDVITIKKSSYNYKLVHYRNVQI